jgi:hypothetical protein
VEADLVAHSGPVTNGAFVQTLVVTDIASGWTELAPLLVREQTLLIDVLGEIHQRLPFPLLGFDVDNDTVFMNETARSPAPGAAALSLWLQHSIDRRCTHLQQWRAHFGRQCQMPVAHHRLDQRRNNRLQALATNSVRRFPQNNQRLALGGAVYPSRGPWRGAFAGRTGTKHAHRVLAMISCRRRKLVDDA